MKNFVSKNSLYLLTVLGVIVLLFLVVNRSALPALQRMDALFFCAVVLHLWEEGRFPGGFTTMITRKLNFTQRDPHFGELITAAYVLFITFVPLFFPDVTWLAMAPLLLGVFEVVAHVGAIKMFNLPRFYSPGLVTAVVVMLPISIYTIVYAVRNNLMPPGAWLFSLLYMVIGLLIAQQIVVRMNGMKYSDFLRNVRASILAK